MRKLLIVLLSVAIPLGGSLPGELRIVEEDDSCDGCGDDGSNTTFPMDVTVRTEEDSDTVTVQTDLHNTSINVLDAETWINVEGGTTHLAPQTTNVTVKQDNIFQTAVYTLTPEVYVATGMVVIAENATYRDTDGDGTAECVGWTKWEVVHVDTGAEEVGQTVMRNATGLNPDGQEVAFNDTEWSTTANPSVMQNESTWRYGGGDNIETWEIRYRRYVEGTLEDDTGTLKVSSENLADC